MLKLIPVVMLLLISCKEKIETPEELITQVNELKAEVSTLKKLMEINTENNNRKLSQFEADLKKLDQFEQQLKKSEIMIQQNEQIMKSLIQSNTHIEKLIEAKTKK